MAVYHLGRLSVRFDWINTAVTLSYCALTAVNALLAGYVARRSRLEREAARRALMDLLKVAEHKAKTRHFDVN
jgi:hypothetical protein